MGHYTIGVGVVEGVGAEAAAFFVGEGAGTASVVTFGLVPVVETESVVEDAEAAAEDEDEVEDAIGTTDAVVDFEVAGAALLEDSLERV